MKEIKEGDKIYREYTITNIRNDSILDLLCENNTIGGCTIGGCTIGGNSYKYSPIQIYFTKEELKEKLNLKPEYPKWMMVSDDNINFCKRYVVAKHNDNYISIEIACNNEQLKNHENSWDWKYAKDIEEESTQKQELLTKADELIKQSEELVKKAEEIKVQANKL